MTSTRTLKVHVSSSVIGDGEIAPPTTNEVLTGPLTFVEMPFDTPDVVRVRALLVPSGSDPIWQYTGEDSPRRWEWTGLLRGDGWTASWRGFVPRTGEVELIGRFWGTFGYHTDGTFRGRVTRIRMVSERYERRNGRGWYFVPGFRRLREVDAAPQFFGVEAFMQDTVDEVDEENSVVVDLDLDDVPALPVCPRIVPGAVSSCGGTLWVVDASLPLVVSVDADDSVHRYLLPARMGESRQVHATPSGCWVTGSDGTFWVASGSEPVRIDDCRAHGGAAIGDTMVVCTGTSTWRLYAPGVDPVDIPAVAGYLISVAVQNDCVFAVVRPEREGIVRLVRVSGAGESTIGPAVPLLPRGHGAPFLMGSPLRLVRGSDVGVVRADLSIRHDGELVRRPFHGGQAGPVAWTVGRIPDGSSASGWWPLPGPVEYDTSEHLWLLTIHDPITLEPRTSVAVTTHQPRVVFDDSGTLIVAGRDLRRFGLDAPLMDRGDALDVAGLLERSDIAPS